MDSDKNRPTFVSPPKRSSTTASASRKCLRIFPILSVLISIGASIVWAKCMYDLILSVSDLRQMVRLAILKKVDEEIEEELDMYFPGPKGNKGTIKIEEPPPDDSEEKFIHPLIFLLIGSGFILIQLMHCLIAMWLHISLKTGSWEGVRTWIGVTGFLCLITLTGAIIQLMYVSSHPVSLITSFTLICLYLGIALMIIFNFSPKEKNKRKYLEGIEQEDVFITQVEEKKPSNNQGKTNQGVGRVFLEIGHCCL